MGKTNNRNQFTEQIKKPNKKANMALNPPNAGLQAAAQGRSLDINPLTYLEKIQGFDGRKEDLSTFCTNVDDIIPTLTLYNEQAQRMCINIVKSKLTGKARRAMEIHPHINKWKDIKEMLETNFGGFQTSDQLYEDLRGAQYRGDTLDFYNYILHKLALLNQRCRHEERINDVERNIQTAIKVFTTRLPVYMRTVLCALKPTSLEEAIHELSQSGFLHEERQKQQRNHPKPTYNNKNPQTFNNNQRNSKNPQPFNNSQQNSNPQPFNNNQQNNWRPKLYIPQANQQQQFRQNPQWRPQQNQWQSRQQQNQQYRQQGHQPPPEPMEIDASQQTRRQNHFQEDNPTWTGKASNYYSKNDNKFKCDYNEYDSDGNYKYKCRESDPRTYECDPINESRNENQICENFPVLASKQTSGYPIFCSDQQQENCDY